MMHLLAFSCHPELKCSGLGQFLAANQYQDSTVDGDQPESLVKKHNTAIYKHIVVGSSFRVSMPIFLNNWMLFCESGNSCNSFK